MKNYSLDINEVYYICYMLTKSVQSNLFNNCKSISLNSLNQQTHTTKDKLRTYKVSPMTTIGAREKKNIATILKFQQDIVPQVILSEVTDSKDLFLFILLYSLQCKELEVITSTFVMAIIHFFTYLEEKFDLICKHIEMVCIS
ncbi:unnamed protein product [Didymodactylos carnosus]|uniref:Uncharacterized protein n=1 Tax=Didymodactylos carnosus TaxID=1234261 RepID=A0A816G173_9BILA|nr:unnamed protein product [Didymodactylos carnosus]CAF4634151.1 unnamed protein product [Didymodactylos carnosus]